MKQNSQDGLEAKCGMIVEIWILYKKVSKYTNRNSDNQPTVKMKAASQALKGWLRSRRVTAATQALKGWLRSRKWQRMWSKSGIIVWEINVLKEGEDVRWGQWMVD